MLLGLLLPDPCDEHCPADFKKKARELLPQVVGKVGQKDEDLRQALLKFIGDFANWDRSADRTYLEISRGLVKAAHGKTPPLVVDPFAGGGSIPLEALRVGCEAFASDLNPVACFIWKTSHVTVLNWLKNSGVGGRRSKPLPRRSWGSSIHRIGWSKTNRLSLGADRALRINRLRRRDSIIAIFLDCKEGVVQT